MKRLGFFTLWVVGSSLGSTAGAAGPSNSLAAKLDTLFQDSRFTGFTWAIRVQGLGSGQVLFEKNAQTPLIPASSVKLLTAALALKRLGPEFTFRTEAFQSGSALWLKGGGDPSLVTERLYLLASELRATGIKKWDRLCTDDSRLPPAILSQARLPEETDRAFNAPIGALNLNYNSVRVHFRPEKGRLQARVEPPNAFVSLDTSDVKRRKGARWSLTFSREVTAQGDRIRVTGTAPLEGAEKVRYFNVTRPSRYVAQALRVMLEKEGVRVSGSADCSGRVPTGAVPIASVESFPLREIVVLMNKFSNNFISEALVRELAYRSSGASADRQQGLDELERALRDLGVWTEGMHLASPSGLDRETRLTAQAFTGLIRDLAADSSVLPEFLSSLPLAGKDGTLRDRIPEPRPGGSFRAKTGTLDGVGSLVGIAQALSGRIYVFSVLLNYKTIERVDTRFWEAQFAQLLVEEG